MFCNNQHDVAKKLELSPFCSLFDCLAGTQMFVLRVLTPLLELLEPETHKSISVSAATTPSISIPDILFTTMKSSSTRPITTMTTSKDLITGAIHLYALGMILVVVNYLIVIALFYIGISTHTTISTRIILATSTSIVKLLFDVTFLKWVLKDDFELMDIIMVGFLYMLNIFGLLKSLELVDFTLWSVIYFMAVLIVIGQLRRQDKKKAMVQENGDGKDYFAYTLIVV